MDWKKDIKMNEIVKDWDKKKELILLVLFTYAITGIFGGALDYIWNMSLYRVLIWLYRIAVISPALIYLVKHKFKFGELFKVKSVWEPVIGIVMAFLITAVICMLSAPAIDIEGMSMFDTKDYIRLIIHYLLIVAFREELIFRVAIERCVEDNFEKHKYLAPLITAAIFSFWHSFNGTWEQVVITFFTGLIFGYSYYMIKKCSFISVVIGHGLYDFLVVIIGARLRF